MIQWKTAVKPRLKAGANLVYNKLKLLEWKIVYHNSPTRSYNDRVSGWVIKFNGLSGDSRQQGPYSPYKPCNHSLYIGCLTHTVTGWGTTCGGIATHGQWKKSVKPLHINEEEWLAASLLIKAFTKDKKVGHSLWKTGDKMMGNQIMRMGSTRSSSLFIITADRWKYRLDNQIMLTAKHLPGKLNIMADKESMIFYDSMCSKG